MELSREDEVLVIRRMDAFLAELLKQLPAAADPQKDPKALERLYPKPSDDRELNDEWQDFVQPGLKELFQSAIVTVAADLASLSSEDDEASRLRIPLAHADQWLSTLNQARLSIAERNGFGEAEISAPTLPVLRSSRDLQLFQLHFYGLLQELLLRAL